MNKNLELLEEFCNTLDERERPGNVGPIDGIGTPELLKEWLLQNNMIQKDTEVSEEAVHLVYNLRKTIRSLIDTTELEFQKKIFEESRYMLNKIAQECQIIIEFDENLQASLIPSQEGIKGAISYILIAIFEVQKEGTWHRLKLCSAPDCRWVFIDYSRPGTGRWCSMKACGNRAKKRTFRERRKQN